MEKAESKTIKITVTLAGRPYPLQIKEHDEAIIRKIVNEINGKVNRLQQTYTGKDKQDCLALVMLTDFVERYKQDQTTSSALNSELDTIDSVLRLVAGI
jgi:cell division protein ZapA